MTLTDTAVIVAGQVLSYRELEGAELRPVRWLLGQLLGGLGLAVGLILFLNDALRLLPFAGWLTAAAGLLIWGQRGTNRLRLRRLGRQPLHVALPGEAARWQPLLRELNQRIAQAHAAAAAEAEALVAAAASAAADAATVAEAATAAGVGAAAAADPAAPGTLPPGPRPTTPTAPLA